eukprot:jgi/Tetstr1/440316/TSEL_028653.t1
MQWSSIGLLEPWMMHTLRDTVHTLTLLTESRNRSMIMFKPWLAARGGCFPEALDAACLDDLLLRLYKMNKMLKEAPSEIVDGKSDALLAMLNSHLSEFCRLQAHGHRVELEQMIFEIRRVASAAEYKRIFGQIYVREVVRMSGTFRIAWGVAFSTMQSLSSAELRQRMRKGDLPAGMGIPERLVKSGIKYFQRTFQQPLQDVVDGKPSQDAATRCCLYLLS